MDDTICVFDCDGSFSFNKQKRFKGHTSIGYACGLDNSPGDGRYLVSGDANGHAVFWDWKTTKEVGRVKAHEQVCIDVAWHPMKRNTVATCSWDGSIKLIK